MTWGRNKFDRDSIIVLADPIQDWKTWKTCAQSLIEPLGLEIIGTILKSEGYKVKVLQAQGEEEDSFLKKILSYDPLIVGLTSYTYNYNNALRIAEKIKNINANIVIIWGGYHATFVLDVLKHDAIDFIVRGPGEITFLELVRAIEKGKNIKEVKSIAYKENAKIVENVLEVRFPNYDELPHALRDERILKRCRIEANMDPPPQQQINTAAIFASRGCPFKCTYCTSNEFYKNKVIYRNPSNVVQEIRYLEKEIGTNTLYFTDLTFNLNKDYIIGLCNRMIEAKIKAKWYALFRPEGIDADLAKILKRAGCSKAGIGIEAFDAGDLQKINRNSIGYFDELEYSLLNLKRAGIITRGLIMIGYPWETIESYKRIKLKLKSLKLDEIRVGIITPFPGTELYKQYEGEGRNLSRDYRKYDGRHIVTHLDYLEPEEVLNQMENIYKGFVTNIYC